MKRIIALLLTCAILLSVAPTEALAAYGADRQHANTGKTGSLSEIFQGLQGDLKTAEAKSVDNGVSAVSSTTEDDFLYEVLNGSFCEISGYIGTDAEVTIPAQMDGYIVQSIADEVFADNTKIKKWYSLM